LKKVVPLAPESNFVFFPYPKHFDKAIEKATAEVSGSTVALILAVTSLAASFKQPRPIESDTAIFTHTA
jgi:hypothetical protein